MFYFRAQLSLSNYPFLKWDQLTNKKTNEPVHSQVQKTFFNPENTKIQRRFPKDVKKNKLIYIS